MKAPVWSYSLLNNYMTCPKQMKERYIDKTLPYVESPEAAYGNRIHKAFELLIKKDISFDDEAGKYIKYANVIKSLPNVSGEMMLGVTNEWKTCDFFASNVWGRGKADITSLITEDTAMLLDIKTGNVREDPFELEVQAVLLKAKYPTLTSIKGCYIWLKEDKYGPVYDLAAKIPETKRAIQDIMRKVEQGLFYANKTPLCGWCPIKHCKHWRDRNVAK